MKSKWWNPKLSVVSLCAVVLPVHFVLKQILARFDVVSCIFAAGDHLPLWLIGCTVVFVMFRVAVFFVVPAVVVWKAVLVLAEKGYRGRS